MSVTGVSKGIQEGVIPSPENIAVTKHVIGETQRQAILH